MKKHSVTFHSPGTFFDETTTREVAAWDHRLVPLAAAMTVAERYGAKPYGFRFSTSIVAEPVPDGEGGTLNVEPKVIAKSGMYYINGTVMRFEDIVDDDADSILRSNMRCNGWPLMVECRNSYRSVHIFEEGDIIVNAAGDIVERGDDPKHVAYRAAMLAEWAKS